MSKSSIADILEVQRLVSKLDKKGKLAILNDLMKQDLEPKKKEESITSIEHFQEKYGVVRAQHENSVMYTGGREG